MAIDVQYSGAQKAALLVLVLASYLVATAECARLGSYDYRGGRGKENAECEPGNFVQVYQRAYNNQNYSAIRAIVSTNVKLLTAAGVVISGPVGETSYFVYYGREIKNMSASRVTSIGNYACTVTVKEYSLE